MYFWKCWRGNTLYFFVFLIAGIVCMAFLGTGLRSAWAASVLSLLIGIASIAVASLIANEEFTDRATHFLFTKPHRRGYFVWTAWAAGLAQVGALLLAGIIVWAIGFAYYGGEFNDAVYFFRPETGGGFVRALVNCLFLYCLTYCLSVVRGNGFEGLGLTLLLTMAVPGVVLWARTQWQIRIPIPGAVIGSLSPAASYLIWAAVGVSLIWVAQVVVERQEV